MMARYTRATAPGAMVAFMRSMIGKVPYSEQDPAPRSDFEDGHEWFPGDPPPTSADCSGSVTMGLRVGGIATNGGSAEMLWIEFEAVRVPATEPLQPGDVGAFLGNPEVGGEANHTAMVATYNEATRTGTIVGEYDTDRGWCEIPFDRDQVGNENNGLGVIGYYRPVNTLPAPPPPPPRRSPPEPPQNPAVEKVAQQKGMVIIDPAEATRAINAGVSYYTWQAGHFVGTRNPHIPPGVDLYAFATNLDEHSIPHAGA